MIIKINVWNRNQYTKAGKLKKKAVTECGFMFGDVGETKQSDIDNWLKEVAWSLKERYRSFESPYIFTHLNAVNKETGESVLIFEEVGLKDGYIITSPEKLRELLK